MTLRDMNVKHATIAQIQNKDGIIVARIFHRNNSYILKYFDNVAFCREINNYTLLASMNIPTLTVLKKTNSALLLEDINESSPYRLGIASDMNDETIAVLLAKWYKKLHEKGHDFLPNNMQLYSEMDYITKENIEFIQSTTQTQHLDVWKVIKENLSSINYIINETVNTITYNDFYYTNFIVARDYSSALMFDYNLLGKGYAYSDIRNVCSSLGENAKAAFLLEYGEFDKKEIVIDDVASIMTTLYFACKRETFPSWATDTLSVLKQDFLPKVESLLSYAK